MATIPPLTSLRSCLLDLSQPIAKRTQAAFYLRTEGSHESMTIICEALRQRQDTALMRHELAYILGQIQDTGACPTLCAILEDEEDDVLVRHESAEALGALGQADSLPILTRFSTHPSPEIAETCQIAIDLINWKVESLAQAASLSETDQKSLFLSHDPAPPLPPGQTKPTIEQLTAILLDPTKSLFQRYRAMFSLRDANSDAAALALTLGFADSSALFRHEVAFVLGQMQRRCSAEALIQALHNVEEHRMVRHEAAEALGAIGGSDIEAVLNRFKESDQDQIVVESCEVALDALNYWETNFAAVDVAN